MKSLSFDAHPCPPNSIALTRVFSPWMVSKFPGPVPWRIHAFFSNPSTLVFHVPPAKLMGLALNLHKLVITRFYGVTQTTTQRCRMPWSASPVSLPSLGDSPNNLTTASHPSGIAWLACSSRKKMMPKFQRQKAHLCS